MHQKIPKDEEVQLLPATEAGPVAKPIRYAHLWKATKTYNDAFEFDPLMLYIRAGVKLPRATTRARSFATLLQWKGRRIMLTINSGRALVITSLELDKPRLPLEHLFDFVANRILDIFDSKPTVEQQKRLEEANIKTGSLIAEIIGDRVTEMVFIGLLATEPASQKRGYGGTLVEAINDLSPIRLN